ncbi:MAG: hypothetical protein JWM60_1652 [Solirubrobacterales bacterium]|nr:hypothetical protein [Solirubrobacterales bacterium]
MGEGDAEDESIVLNEAQLGAIAVQLALDFPTWIERRIERVSYLDRSTVSVSEGVMFRLPEPEFFAAASRPEWGTRIFAPLDLLSKDSLAGLDGYRPDGSPVPILPYARSARLANAGVGGFLVGKALMALGKPLDHASQRTVQAIVTATARRAKPLARVALQDPNLQLRRIFENEDPIEGLLRELASSVMMLVPVDYEPGEEHVYRYSYGQTMEQPRALIRLAERAVHKDLEVKHEPLAIGWSRSYHFEVDVPAEVYVARAQLFGIYDLQTEQTPAPIAEADGGPVVDLHATRPTQLALDDGSAIKPVTRPPVLPPLPTRRATDSYLDSAEKSRPTPTQRSDTGIAKIRFRLEPNGTFLATMLVACLTAVLLLLARGRLRQLDGQTDAALLLALPILTLGYMTRPGEHRFATRLLVGIRGASLIVGVCALALAWVLASGAVTHQGPGALRYECGAGVTDLPPHKAAGQSWARTRDPDSVHMDCHATRTGKGSTKVRPWAQATADAAAYVAVALAIWLLSGWLISLLWARGPLKPEPQREPDDERRRHPVTGSAGGGV